jgi:hypothetical protein
MISTARAIYRPCDATRATHSHQMRASSPSLDSRRREIRVLLDDIKAPAPTATEIIEAVAQASEGALSREHLDRITSRILSLYEER